MKRITALIILLVSLFVSCAPQGEREAAYPTSAPAGSVTQEPAEPVTAEPTENLTAEPTGAPAEAPTAEPAPAVTAAPAATPKPTAKPTAAPTGKPDQSIFDDAVLIGNSVLHGLYQFGVITHGDFITRVGLNVNTIYTYTDDDGVILIDKLRGKHYGKAVLNFGLNEVGWPNQTAFINHYKKLIDDIRERVPGVKIYVVAMTPVTKKYSQSTGQENGINIENIRRTNELIRLMCGEKGAVFIDNPKALLDSEGYLPSEASADGVHMNLQYDRIWADHITVSVAAAH